MRRAAVNIIILIVAVALLGACHRESRVEWLEPLTDDYPDSALTILRHLSQEKLSARDRAICNLLLTRAIDKSSADYQTDDSLARAALDYFSRHDDPHFEMLAHYYLGQIAFTNKDYTEAICQLNEGVDVARQLQDHINLALFYRTFSDLYQATYYGPDAVQYSKLALEEFVKSGDKGQKYIGWTHIDIASAFRSSGEFDSCILWSDRALEFAAQNNDQVLARASRLEKAMGLSFINDNAPSNKLMEETLKYVDDDGLNVQELFVLSLNYARLGNAEKSHHYAELMEQLGHPFERDYINLYHAGKYKDAYLDLSRVITKYNSAFLGLERSQIGQAQKLYDKLKVEKKENQYQSKVLTMRLWIVSILFIIVIIGFIAIYYHKKYKEKILEINLKIEETNRLINSEKTKDQELIILRESKSQLEDIHNENIIALRNKHLNIIKGIRKIMIDEMKGLEIFFTTYIENQENNSLRKSLYNNTQQYLKSRDIKGETTRKVERAIDENLNQLMKRFRSDFPDFKDMYYFVFMYSVLGFSTTGIAVFLQTDMKKISDLKYRIAKIIKNSNSEFQEEYLLYMR